MYTYYTNREQTKLKENDISLFFATVEITQRTNWNLRNEYYCEGIQSNR